jgi:hypothetical protein
MEDFLEGVNYSQILANPGKSERNYQAMPNVHI